MELIIKPTSVCNFQCSFCAASDLTIQHATNSVPDKIKNIITELHPDKIIITGGEPLCCPPEYYYDLLEFCDCEVSFTTNLKDFYLNPDKWTELFRNPRIGVCTSFNYGDTRRWSVNKPYTENQFRKVMSLFKKLIGYMPMFIAVIDNNNEDTCIKHIELAKEVGTICRLNNANKIGRQNAGYPRYKIFKKWLNIIECGLSDYEMNCIERKIGRCPINASLTCNDCIRAVYLDVNNNIHLSSCEDLLNLGIEKQTIDKTPINNKCVYCELYRICNGCDITREDTRCVQEHCSEMLKLKDQIIKEQWKL